MKEVPVLSKLLSTYEMPVNCCQAREYVTRAFLEISQNTSKALNSRRLENKKLAIFKTNIVPSIAT